MDDENRKCASCPSVALPNRSECQRCVEARARRLKERSQAKRARGECVKCSNQAVDGLTLCQACIDKNNNRGLKRRNDRREIGLCKTCGKAARIGKTRCSSCSKKESVAEIKKRSKHADDCVCIQCGDEIETGFARCPRCLEDQRRYTATRKARIINGGLCIRCGKERPVVGHSHCLECVYKAASQSHLKTNAYWRELQDKYHQQNGKCPYFGLPIEVGINAELDHRIPKAKGGTSDLDNLQWVHVWANVMKADMTEEEFLRKFRKALPTIVETNKARV